MSKLIERERALYGDILQLPAYAEHSPGERYLPIFRDMTDAQQTASILDAGCGTGKGALALAAAGFADVRCCDLTPAGILAEASGFPFWEACLWSEEMRRVPPVDWVYCTDVLEHIPTAFTMLVVSHLLTVAQRGVFLSISFMPDSFGVWVGEHLHQTVQPFVWWRDHLDAVGRLVEARDLLNGGAFLVKAR